MTAVAAATTNIDEVIVGNATPWFVVAVLVEVVVGIIAKRKLYVFNDTISNLSNGMLSIVLGALITSWSSMFYVGVFDAVWNNNTQGGGGDVASATSSLTFFESFMAKFGVFAAWTLAYLGVDLGYYWFHRVSHEVQLMWMGHGTHHNGNGYNYSTALRQGTLEKLFNPPFYFHMAVLGVPTRMFLIARSTHTIYQFLPHTQLVKKLPWVIEFVFNTPSHHRVHHARNARYLRKNFAGMFVLWDRIFGTFQAELESDPCVYHHEAPPRTFSPVEAQLGYVTTWGGNVVEGSRSLLGMVWYMIFRKPVPKCTPHCELIQKEGSANALKAWRGVMERNVIRDLYVLFHFAVASAMFLSSAVGKEEGDTANTGAGLAAYAPMFTTLTLLSLGALLDDGAFSKNAAFVLEVSRLSIAFGVAASFVLSKGPSTLPLGASIASIISACVCVSGRSSSSRIEKKLS